MSETAASREGRKRVCLAGHVNIFAWDARVTPRFTHAFVWWTRRGGAHVDNLLGACQPVPAMAYVHCLFVYAFRAWSAGDAQHPGGGVEPALQGHEHAAGPR